MPTQVPSGSEVYSIDEINALLILKADKVNHAVNNDVAGLTGDEGNLLDTGYSLGQLMVGDVIDGGTF